VRGPRGEAGADGSVWLEGDRTPKPDEGIELDLWLNTKTIDLFQKQRGAWRKIANIRGKPGETGPRGASGFTGPPGESGIGGSGDHSSIFVGDGPPAVGGVVGQQILVGDGPPPPRLGLLTVETLLVENILKEYGG
jgi:hypothetical protein